VQCWPALQLHHHRPDSHFIVRAQLIRTGASESRQTHRKVATQSPETNATLARSQVSRATEEEP